MFGCLSLHYDYSCALIKHVLITSSVPTGLKLSNVHACNCVCCIVRQMLRGLKTITSWSVFHRICVILWFLLLYFMLHNGCVTCHIVLTLIECNLQILCLFSWLVHCTVYSNTTRTCYQNWICFHHQVTGWGGICWTGSDRGSCRILVQWLRQLRLSDPNTYASPPFHPRIWTVPVSEILLFF